VHGPAAGLGHSVDVGRIGDYSRLHNKETARPAELGPPLYQVVIATGVVLAVLVPV
jgi:hypothetical protein